MPKNTVNIIVSISNKKWVSDILFLFKSVPQIANRVILEITESNIIRDYKSVFDFIFKFMSIGCKVALDDFGKNPCLQLIEVEKLAVQDPRTYSPRHADPRLLELPVLPT